MDYSLDLYTYRVSYMREHSFPVHMYMYMILLFQWKTPDRRRLHCSLEMAAYETIITGASLFGTSLEEMSDNIKTERNVAISISNYSKNYILRNPRVYNFTGYSHNPPQPTIGKATMEACSFTKDPATDSGCTFVLMYEVAVSEGFDTACFAAFLISVPQDYKSWENILALGLFSSDQACDEGLYNTMYYKNESGSFTRKTSSEGVVVYEDKKHHIKLKGIMSPRAKAIAKLELWDI
ncbi:hypothetical protein NFI96_013300 [Prochilodus magdalenae]|nr:hypothetical protein NFI96_013300 [Prochilodus magdalenae]